VARYLGPACRICRRQGMKLFLKGTKCLTAKCPFSRRGYAPGQHGQARVKLSTSDTQTLGADGSRSEILTIPGGGSRHPLGENGQLGNHPPYIFMDGKEVFKHAVIRMIEASLMALQKCGKTPEDLKLLIPHQANLRIIDAIAKRLKLSEDKVFRNVHKYGNMSAATTIIALDEAQREGRVQRGDLVELIAFGAGLTWGAAVLRW